MREPIAEDEIAVPGESYTPLILCEQDHPGAMPDVPQFEMIGILSYDKELEVYIGMAFPPGAVDRAQAEAIAQSIELSPLK